MRKFATLTRAVSTIGALSLVLAAACGDDDGVNPDARRPADAMQNPDAEPPPPDAMLATIRGGTIAVIEAYLTNPQAAAACGVGETERCLSGSNITVAFGDGRTGTAPHPDWTDPVGSCKIIVYDVGNDSPATPTDEGPVSIMGTSHGTVGCGYNSQLQQYLCANPGTGFSGALPANTVALAGGGGAVIVTISGADFTSIRDNLRGMWVNFTGFETDADAGAGPTMNGNFPVLLAGPISVPGLTLTAEQLLILNPAMPTLGQSETATAGSTYATFAGAGPIPSAGLDSFDTFLDDGSTDIVINKPTSSTTCTEGEDCTTDSISETLRANGAGFTLDANSAQPHALPTSGDVSFSCSDAVTGECGPAAPVGTGGLLNVLVVSGETTDGDINGLSPFDMPAPVSSYATFQCSALGATNGVTIDAAAMAVIMGTSPTRIFTQVIHANGSIVTNATTNTNTSSTNVLAGHGVAGFTDITP